MKEGEKRKKRQNQKVRGVTFLAAPKKASESLETKLTMALTGVLMVVDLV